MPILDWPGENLAIRIWATLERAGIGILLPGQLRREGKARAEVEYLQRLALAQAEKDAADLAAGRVTYDPGTGRVQPLGGRVEPKLLSSTAPPTETPDANSPPVLGSIPRLGSALDFGAGVARSVALREMRRAINLERIAQQSQSEADSMSAADVSDKEVHPDWVAKWRDGAQDVSDEDVQRLWARTLAGEVASPGRYSLRTLDFLRSVSKAEAELIAKIVPYVVSAFIYKDEETLIYVTCTHHRCRMEQWLQPSAGGDSNSKYRTLRYLASPLRAQSVA